MMVALNQAIASETAVSAQAWEAFSAAIADGSTKEVATNSMGHYETS